MDKVQTNSAEPEQTAGEIQTSTESPQTYKMPLILFDRRGRVDNVIFPKETLENPPRGTEKIQLELLEDASNYGILRKLRYTDSVIRTIEYYSTQITGLEIAEREKLTNPTVYMSIHNTMRAIHRRLLRVRPDYFAVKYPDINKIAVGKKLDVEKIVRIMREANPKVNPTIKGKKS